MSDWTREPWPDGRLATHPPDQKWWFTSDGGAWLSRVDYDRARACVNALAGRVPEKLAALEDAIEELLAHDSATDWPWSQNAWDELAKALAAFRGETP